MRSLPVVVLGMVLAGCQPVGGGEASPPSSGTVAATLSASRPSTASSPPAETSSPAPAVEGRLAFQRTGGDGGGVLLIDADGGDPRQVLSGSFGTPKWSPDGAWLAVYAERADGTVVPAVVRPDGSGYRELALSPGLSCGLAAWAPDGRTLALECWSDDPARVGIYLASATDDVDLRQMTSGHGLPGQFTRDGRRLLFAQDIDATRVELHIVDLDGSREQAIGTVSVGQMPGFVPGDLSIYVVSGGEIDILDLGGGHLRSIQAPERKIVEARLSPDGLTFAFIYDPQAAVAPGLYRIGFDGSGFAPIVHTDRPGIQEEHPDWKP